MEGGGQRSDLWGQDNTNSGYLGEEDENAAFVATVVGMSVNCIARQEYGAMVSRFCLAASILFIIPL